MVPSHFAKKGQPRPELTFAHVGLLAEVALQEAFESLAMARLVAGHFVHGVRRFSTGMLYLIYIFEASSVQVLYFSITSF